MAGHGSGPNSLETKTRTAMEDLGTYSPAFDPAIRTLAKTERELRRAEKAWRAAGSPLTVTQPNQSGKDYTTESPVYRAVQSLRADVQAQRDALGLTPKALRKTIVGLAAEEADPAAAALADYAARIDDIIARTAAYGAPAPHRDTVLTYARDRATGGPIAACEGTRLACDRYLRDLTSDRWDVRTDMAEAIIAIIEDTLCHVKGERPDGTPLRGTPLYLLPWQQFVVYNLCGFFQPGTDLRRFVEDMVFVPRKNAKTTFMAALSWALAWYYRRSAAVVYIIGGTSRQAVQAFDFLAGNARRLGLAGDAALKINDNLMDHRILGEVPDGSIEIAALAYKEGSLDSLNCSIVLADELHVYKSSAPYTLMQQATKAYSNKLVSGISTAGDDGMGFCAQRREYALRVLRGLVTGADADRFFAFLTYAERGDDGEVPFTDSTAHAMANPSFGEIIRPTDLMGDALAAQNDPQLRKDFLTRGLNVFVSSVRAYFDVETFRASDACYNWTMADLAKLPVRWYGGADLARLHDLTATALVGEYDDVLIVIPHCWFPITAAAAKAEEDRIPVFGWQEDGWLDLSNDAVTNHAEPVRWFRERRDLDGFKIRQVGHDRKFCPEYVEAMKAARFQVVDQPQLHYLKSQGFRHLEKKALTKKLYYLHAEPFAYCAANLYAVEKEDDVVVYDKLKPNLRIDVFDASVFACVRLLADMGKLKQAEKWFQP